MTSNDIEAKKKKIELIVKVVGLGIAGALFAPFALATIQGVISLVIVGTLGLVAVNVGIPWLGASIANWKLKALKAAAAANPIEELENIQQVKTDALKGSRDNLKKRVAIASDIFSQITQYETDFKKPSPFRPKYAKMMALIEVAKVKYKAAQKALVAYGQFVDEKRAEWRIALSMAEADKLDNVGTDFITKMMQDTAVQTINDSLNFSFAELDASVLDAESNKEIHDSQMAPTADVIAAKPLAPPSELDFEFQDGSAQPSRRQRVATA